MKVKECMCNDVCFIKPETNLYEAAQIMSENHIGCVPVCDNQNNICGVITDRDILLRCVCCNKDIKNTKDSDIMTCNVCTCKPEDEVKQAENVMSQNQVRRLPVCDENNKIVGMLTIGDLAHSVDKIDEQFFCQTIENICCNENAKRNS